MLARKLPGLRQRPATSSRRNCIIMQLCVQYARCLFLNLNIVIPPVSGINLVIVFTAYSWSIDINRTVGPYDALVRNLSNKHTLPSVELWSVQLNYRRCTGPSVCTRPWQYSRVIRPNVVGARFVYHSRTVYDNSNFL